MKIMRTWEILVRNDPDNLALVLIVANLFLNIDYLEVLNEHIICAEILVRKESR